MYRKISLNFYPVHNKRCSLVLTFLFPIVEDNKGGFVTIAFIVIIGSQYKVINKGISTTDLSNNGFMNFSLKDPLRFE